MPSLRDLDRRISSVTSIKQITRTMEMVASAKVRQATARMKATAPYAESMTEMLAEVAQRVSGSENDLLRVHDEVKNVLIVAVASDRGLAGSFNSNVMHRVERIVREKQADGAEVQIIACGKKAVGYFTYRKLKPVLTFEDLSADPTVEEAGSIASYAIDGYNNGEIDEVVVVYNHAKNAMEQVLTVDQVLPVDTSEFIDEGPEFEFNDEETAKAKEEQVLEGDVIFEPSPEGVLEKLLPAYIRTKIHQALNDSAAGEQTARRTAMMAATDNATEMIETLTRQYNRVRQGAITTEIAEIVGGAAAMED